MAFTSFNSLNSLLRQKKRPNVVVGGVIQTLTIPYTNPPTAGTNYGNAWTLDTLAQTTASTFYSYCSMSSNGQYMCVSQYNVGIWVSSNYGVSWTKTYSISNASFAWVNVSSTGKYMYVYTYSSDFHYSSDYGATFRLLTQKVSNDGFPSISYNEQYGLCIYNSILSYSTDYGSTWTTTAQFGTSPITRFSITSYTGGIQVVTTDTTVYISVNTGFVWTTSYASCVGITSCLLSADGKYISILGTNTIYIGTWTSGTNYTWTTTTLTGVYRICMNFTGRYLVASSTTAMQYSTNYGITWTSSTITLNTNNTIYKLSSSLDGKYVLYSTNCETVGFNGGYIYMSNDFGATFAQKYAGNLGKSIYPFLSLSKDGYYQLSCFNSPTSTSIFSSG